MSVAAIDPLIPRGGDNNNNVVADGRRGQADDPVDQSLGGKTYKIDTSQLAVRMAEKSQKPLWKRVLQSGFTFLALPIIVPTVAAYVAFMFVAPRKTRNKLIEDSVSAAMKNIGELFDEERKELLEENIGPDDVMLDLGAGSGNYLKYLCKGGKLVAIEPVEKFHEGYKSAAIEAGMQESQVEVHACDIETYVRDNPQAKGTFDWVILGNVLCEVPDQMSTLQCVRDLLKPGGHVYFSEHVGMPRGTFSRRIQDIVNPVWKTAGAGCNCNCDSLANIRQTPGWQVISWQFFGFKVVLGPWVMGLAMKDDVEKNTA